MVELLTTLAVVGVILAITVPNFRSFVLNSRMTGSANDLLASMQLARSEAIKRQRPVALCSSENPEAEPPDCADEFSGWVVWVDADNDAVVGADEEIISTHEPLETSLTLTSTGGGLVSYTPDGFPQPDVGGTGLSRFILICDERGNAQVGDSYRKRVVLLSRTGRPGVLKTIEEFTNHGPEFAAIGANPNCL